MAMPPAPGAPRTFPGDPNPPPQAPDPAPKAAPSTGAPTSAGTGALPPTNPAGASGPPPGASASSPEPMYRIISRQDGSRDVIADDPKNGPSTVGKVTLSPEDADKMLSAVGQHDPERGVWDNVPPSVAKALMQGRPGFIEEMKQRWNMGESELVQNLLGAKVMNGEMTAAAAREQAAPELVKSRLLQRPELAWHGLGGAVVDMVKHPVDTARDVAGALVESGPVLRDTITHGTIPGAAEGIAGGGAAVAAASLAGPVAPATVSAAVMGAAGVGASYGTFKRVMDVQGGAFAMDMARQGYEDGTIQKWAPVVGAFQGALASVNFDLLTAPAQKVALEEIANSPEIKAAIAAKIARYMGKGAVAAAPMTGMAAVNIMSKNLLASVYNRPDEAVSGAEATRQLFNAALQGVVLSGTVHGVRALVSMRGAAETEGGRGTSAQERPAASSLPEETAPGKAPLNPATGEASAEPSLTPSQSPESQRPTGEVSSYDPSIARSPEVGKGGYGSMDHIAAAGEVHPELMAEAHNLLVGADARDFAERTTLDDGILRTTMGALKAESEAQFEMFAKAPENLEPGQAAHFADALDRAIRRYKLGTTEDVPDGVEALADRFREQAQAKTEEPAAPAAEPNKYVLGREIAAEDKGTDKATTKNLRDEYAGVKNEQLVRGNQLADEIKRDVPDVKDREGMFWYKAAEGDKAVLQDALADPELAKYHPQIERALALPANAVEALKKVDQYYKESGEVSSEIGTIRNVLENYQNRLYEKDDEPVRTEAGSSGLKQTTRHAKQRVFDTEFDAARAGKTFATTDVADALALHNGEMARVNAARSLADKMSAAGLGAWKQQGNVPEGWAQVGELSKDVPLKGRDGKALIGEDGNQVHSRSVFVAPEGIAKGLRALVDPDWTKKMDVLKDVQSAQGAVKTGFLSWSFFHHLSFVSQLVYRGDFSSLMQLKNMDEALAHPDFLENEKDFALHGGLTAQVEANADIERGLAALKNDESISGKARNLPIAKQVLEQTDKNANFLFGKMQRLWKVNTYAAERSNWIADHPDASNAEVTTALRGMAASTNDIFGGQNWEAMGMTKSNLSLLRLGILAPDWTASNLSLLKHAVGLGDNAAENSMSRAHVIKALAVGMVGTELMNKLLTGHTTDKNAPGHKLEVELAPNVYVSLIRGGPADILKLASMTQESGAAGADRFAAGKLSPSARIMIGLASNTQYTGKPIVPKKDRGPVAGTYDVLKYVLTNASPIPLGISNLWQYADEKHATALGAAAVGSGVGRYSKPPKGKE